MQYRDKILLMEKKLKLKKIDAHSDELVLSRLRLEGKIADLDEEIALTKNTLEELNIEINELEAQGE